MSAKRQIRLYCRWCCMGSSPEVAKCPVEDCPIWPFREGATIKGKSKMKAVKRKCADCIQTTRTSMCKEKTCQLYGYRDGHRPQTEPETDQKIVKLSSKVPVSATRFQVKPKRRLITRIKSD